MSGTDVIRSGSFSAALLALEPAEFARIPLRDARGAWRTPPFAISGRTDPKPHPDRSRCRMHGTAERCTEVAPRNDRLAQSAGTGLAESIFRTGAHSLVGLSSEEIAV